MKSISISADVLEHAPNDVDYRATVLEHCLLSLIDSIDSAGLLESHGTGIRDIIKTRNESAEILRYVYAGR